MPLATETPTSAQAAGPRYYRSFASYHIPFRPIDEMTYPETEGLAAYYVVFRDFAERVVRFTKIQVEQLRPGHEFYMALQPPASPGTMVYFAVTDQSERFPNRDDQIQYSDTLDRREYYTGIIEFDRTEAKVVRVKKQEVFTDEYEYWPSGQLRKRVTSRPGQPIVFESYDERGRLVKTERVVPNVE